VAGDWFQPVTEAQELQVATGTPCERRGVKETTEAALLAFFILSLDLVLREGVFAHAFLEDFSFRLPSSFCKCCQPIFLCILVPVLRVWVNYRLRSVCFLFCSLVSAFEGVCKKQRQ
jgi:hypothetical protein